MLGRLIQVVIYAVLVYLNNLGEDSQALVWDISQMSRNKMITEPILAFNAENEINNLSWNGSLHDWIAISSGNTVQALRV